MCIPTMEQVFYRLHVRTIRVLTSVLKPQLRNALEKVVLMNAFLAFVILCWLHTTYVNSPPSVHNNCLYELLSKQASAGRLADYDVIKLHLSNERFKHFPRDEQVLRDSLFTCEVGDTSSGNASCRNGSGGGGGGGGGGDGGDGIGDGDDGDDAAPAAASDGVGAGRNADPVTDGAAFSEEQLPLLFDKFIRTVGLHVDDSQPDPKGARGRGGAGSARLYSVAGRLLSGAQATPGGATEGATDGAVPGGSEAWSGRDADEVLAAAATITTKTMTTATAAGGSSEEVAGGGNPGCDVLTGRGCEDSQLTGRLKELFVSQRVYLFSLEKGYLMLRPDQRDRHDIRRLDITVSTDSSCFGPPAVVWLLQSFVGFDTVVMNWAISLFGGQGYLYNVYSKELFNLNFAAEFARSGGASSGGEDAQHRDLGGAFAALEERRARTFKLDDHDATAFVAAGEWGQHLWALARQAHRRLRLVGGGSRGRLSDLSLSALQHFVAFKVGVVLTTIFLFFTTTTLVSFTLRETQERMLKFTFMLQHHISHRIPYAALVFTHVVETLVFVPIMVGILFFLFEFFSDQLLAFMVLSVVWLCEVFSVVCLRSGPSIRFFPRVFFCYFSMFHVYFFSFPFGFSYLALGTTVLFIQHSMLFCWNAFEIPALETGLITAVTPRVGMTVSVLAGVGAEINADGVALGTGFSSNIGGEMPRPDLGRGFEVGAGTMEQNVPVLLDGRSGAVNHSTGSSSGDGGNEESSSEVGGGVRERSGGLAGRRTAVAPASPNRSAPDVGVLAAGAAVGQTRRVRRTSGGVLLYSPSRGPGFPSSSSDTDLIDETRYASRDAVRTSTGASAGAGFYSRHFDLSRRIQAEQLSAMLGLPSQHHQHHQHQQHHHLQSPPQPSPQAQVHAHAHYLRQPVPPFSITTPSFDASPLHDDSPVSAGLIPSAPVESRVVQGLRQQRRPVGEPTAPAVGSSSATGAGADAGEKPLSFPLSALASVGRAIDRGLGWVVSRMAEDSESDVASEGSEWLLAATPLTAGCGSDGGRMRLLRRHNALDKSSDSSDEDEEGHGAGGGSGSPGMRHGLDGVGADDTDAGWHGALAAIRGRCRSAENAASPQWFTRSSVNDNSKVPVATGAPGSPSKYEHFQRELVAYGSSDFDLSKEIEIASARSSTYSSPARCDLRQQPQQQNGAEAADALELEAVMCLTRPISNSSGAGRSLYAPTVLAVVDTAVSEQSRSRGDASTTPHLCNDDDDYVVGAKLGADANDYQLNRADGAAAAVAGAGARNRADSQCSRSSGGTGFGAGFGVGLQPIVSSASLAGLASPGGSRESSGTGSGTVAAPLPFPQMGGAASCTADHGAGPATETLSMHSSLNTLSSSSPSSSPASLQGRRSCSVNAFGYRRSEFTIFGTNFDEEN